MFRKLRKDKRGMAGVALALAIGLVTIAIVLPIGIWIQAAFEGTFSGGGTTKRWINNSGSLGFNTTIESILSNSLSGFSLGSILPIVFAAGAIIAALVGFMAFRKGGGGGF